VGEIKVCSGKDKPKGPSARIRAACGKQGVRANLRIHNGWKKKRLGLVKGRTFLPR